MRPVPGVPGSLASAAASAVVGAAVWLLCGPVSAGSEVPTLVTVPQPMLEKLETSVQEQLGAERDFLDGLIEAGELGPEMLGRVFGAMGQLYYLYDLLPAAEACFSNAQVLLTEDYRWPYYLGVLHQFEGDLESARGSFERTLALQPPDLPAAIRLGDILLEIDELTPAEQSFRKTLALDPDSAAANYGLGRIEYERGELAAAIGFLDTALQLQPEADSIHHLLGMAYRRLGDLDRAKLHVELNQHTRVTFPDPLIDDLIHLLRSAQVHFEAGIEALRQEDFHQAIEHFRNALVIDERDFLTHHHLALALVATDADQEAIAEFRAALELNPEYSYSHFDLASVLTRQGFYGEAAAHYEEAHRLDSDDRVTHLAWASALDRAGEPRRAREQLEKLLAAEPAMAVSQQAEAHWRLGGLSERAGDQLGALRHYEKAVELAPESIGALHSLATTLGRVARYRAAAEHYSTLVAVDPQNPRAHFGRAMALILDSDYAGASLQIERSLERLPESRPLSHLQARFLATCPDPAIRDGDRALRLATRVFQAENTLDHAETVAMALAELGRFEEAAEWQQRVVDEAVRSGELRVAEQSRLRLGLYQRGLPVRAPWKSGV